MELGPVGDVVVAASMEGSQKATNLNSILQYHLLLPATHSLFYSCYLHPDLHPCSVLMLITPA
jgi:hypothetical protein